MPWEVFKRPRGQWSTRLRAPEVLFTGKVLILTKAARDLLGDRRLVTLAADRDTREILITPTSAAPSASAFSVSAAGAISAAAFGRYFGFRPGQRWSLRQVDRGASLRGTPIEK